MAKIPGTGFTSEQQYNPTVRGPEDYSAQIQGAQQRTQQRNRLKSSIQQAGKQIGDVTSRIISAVQEHRVFQDSLMWERELEKSADSVMKMVAGAGDEVGGEGMEGFTTSGVQGFEEEAEGMQRWQMATELFEKEAEEIFKQGKTSSGLFSGAGRRQFDQMKQRYWQRVRDRQQELFGMQLEHLTEKSFTMAIEQESPSAVVRAAQFARDNGAIKPWEQAEMRQNGLSEISFRQSSRDAMAVAQANGQVVEGKSNIDAALRASRPPSASLRRYVTTALEGSTPQEAAEFVRKQAENGEVNQRTAQAARRLLLSPSNAKGRQGPGLGVFRDPQTDTWHMISNKQFENIHGQVREYAEREFKDRRFSTFNDWRTQIAVQKANGTINNDEWRARIRENRGLLGYSNYDEKDLASKLLRLLEEPTSSGGGGAEAMYQETKYWDMVSEIMRSENLPRATGQEMINDIMKQIPKDTGIARYDGLYQYLLEYSNNTNNWQERSQIAQDVFKDLDGLIQDRIDLAEDNDNIDLRNKLQQAKGDMMKDAMSFLTDQAEFSRNDAGRLEFNEKAVEDLRRGFRMRLSDTDFSSSLREMMGNPSGELENASFGLVNTGGVRGRLQKSRKQSATTAARIMSSPAIAGMDSVEVAEFQNEAAADLGNFFAEEFGASRIQMRPIPRKNGEVYLAPQIKEGQMREGRMENYIYKQENGVARHVMSYRDQNGDGTFRWMIANVGQSNDIEGEIRWEPVPDDIKRNMSTGYKGFTALPSVDTSVGGTEVPDQPDTSGNANPYNMTYEQMKNQPGITEEDLRAAFPERFEREAGGTSGGRGGITQ